MPPTPALGALPCPAFPAGAPVPPEPLLMLTPEAPPVSELSELFAPLQPSRAPMMHAISESVRMRVIDAESEPSKNIAKYAKAHLFVAQIGSRGPSPIVL